MSYMACWNNSRIPVRLHKASTTVERKKGKRKIKKENRKKKRKERKKKGKRKKKKKKKQKKKKVCCRGFVEVYRDYWNYLSMLYTQQKDTMKAVLGYARFMTWLYESACRYRDARLPRKRATTLSDSRFFRMRDKMAWLVFHPIDPACVPVLEPLHTAFYTAQLSCSPADYVIQAPSPRSARARPAGLAWVPYRVVNN